MGNDILDEWVVVFQNFRTPDRKISKGEYYYFGSDLPASHFENNYNFKYQDCYITISTLIYFSPLF